MSDRYTAMDLVQANKKCNTYAIYFVECPSCEMKVGLHCPDCKIQVTGCLDTEIDRFGQNTAIQRLIDRLGFEKAKSYLSKIGMWIPPGIKT